MALDPTCGGFQEIDLGNDIRLHIDSTKTFQRTTIAVFFQRPLNPETIAAAGLLPRVQRRGNTQWPTAMALERELDSLYGTRFSTGVQKTGDRHIAWFLLNLPGDRYLAQPVIDQGLRILQTSILSPVVVNDGLQPDYVEQEKQLQVGRIRALINNKSSYAVHRCMQEMYAAEPFRLFELGTEEEVRCLSPQDLLVAHTEMIKKAPVDVYVVGDVRVAEMEKAFAGLAVAARSPEHLAKTTVSKGSGDYRTVVDEEVMGQGWLVLGYRTDVTYADSARYAMHFLNGILGGFVHSKLFINVREKASLAYQASSGYNPNKGYLLALAGIDPANYEKALEIMLQQVEDIRKGVISPEEMEATRSRLLSRVKLGQDDATNRMLRHLSGVMEDVAESTDEVLHRLAAVSMEDVIAVAERMRLDTVYFLKGVSKA